MSLAHRPAAAACGFACVLTLTSSGCDPPPEPRPSGSRLADARGSEPIPETAGGAILFPPGIDRAALGAGAVALFDGQTLFGWRGTPGVAEVRDGAIVLNAVPRPDGKPGGSDIVYFSMPIPSTPLYTGYGGLSQRDTAGPPAWAQPYSPRPLTSLDTPPDDDPVEVNEDLRAEVAGVSTYLARGGEGVQIGYVVVAPATSGEPSFREVPGNAATVTRENETLRLTGGPGFLRSEETYADFVLRCEVNLHGEDSNSGLFFRTADPTEDAPSNGYEVQLQNTLGPGGRTDPDDYGEGFGTGGIFRRQPARYVNADDGEWFALTLICVGNRMATWVNGLQVTDYTDDRTPDPNPRKGRQDDAGYLVLQAHDPGTDVSFRNFRIQELTRPGSTESD